MSIDGVDVSHYQGTVDFPRLAAAGKHLVMVKATEGTGFVDPRHAGNVDEARKAGLTVGHYHYFTNTPDAAAQAAFFVRIAARRPGELLALDFEGTAARAGDTAGALTWLEHVLALTGTRPLIYMDIDTLAAGDWSTVVAGDFGLWLACPHNPQAPAAPWPFAAIRQVGTGTTPGVTGPVDLDVFAGDDAQLAAYGAAASAPEFDADQVANGRAILDAVVGQHLDPAEQSAAALDAILAAITESSLHNDDFGDTMPDGQMSTSRGLFQQLAAWGPLDHRMNPAAATRMFLFGGAAGQPGLLDIHGWQDMPAWQAVQAVQQSQFADGSNYRRNLPAAEQFIRDHPLPAPPPPKPTPPPAKPEPPKPAAPRPDPESTQRIYTVHPGDTLSQIAADHRVTVAALIAANRDEYPSLGWNPNLIQIGWHLMIPAGAAAPAPTYTVHSGDTLSGIAAAHHTTVDELVTLNRGRYPTLAGDPNLIDAGWTLRLP